MPPLAPATGITITNPLVLYRSLLARKQINPDPAQHRLAIKLQKLYHRLLDYEPEIEYNYRIKQLSRTVGGNSATAKDHEGRLQPSDIRPPGIFANFRAQKNAAETKALTRKLTDHETAIQLTSPQGLLLYGEVGTGKSMLVDLLADCLPSKKKRRWHFNTFMLETFSRLEQLRRSRSAKTLVEADQESEHSLLLLARDMISTSPILFLDEFQLPDRAASKILSNLLTSFFQLGGVLIATSNRMPEELAKASGIEFAAPPSSRLGLLGTRWGLLGNTKASGRSENMFGAKGDFAAFLEVLRSRCEVFQMEGSKDWRRDESTTVGQEGELVEQGFHGLEGMVPGNVGLGYEQSLHTESHGLEPTKDVSMYKSGLPKNYLLSPRSGPHEDMERRDKDWASTVYKILSIDPAIDSIPWQTTSLRVYGRNLNIPCHISSVTKWSFSDLCCTNLGPADYITIASTYHTLVLEDVPVLSLLQKNEARRLITLLDALYEARCKLLIQAAAGPDDLFFPEAQRSRSTSDDLRSGPESGDSVYSETFSEIYQDTNSPFRPNISSYASSASPPAYASASFPPSAYAPSQSTRSMLADEDSDFGPTYGAGRGTHGPSDGAPGAGNETGRQSGLDFSQTGTFTGEDEHFAYKRATSRLWELCSKKWWDRADLWKPLSKDIRHWERSTPVLVQEPSEALLKEGSSPSQQSDDDLFRHGASPFRTSVEPPPKFSWTHAWGMMQWGKKAGSWGKGPEGLKYRAKRSEGDVGET